MKKTKENVVAFHPTLSNEWHPIKNEGLTPNDVTIGSNKKVWWQCSKGHEWEATIKRRGYGGSCKECKNTVASHPTLSNEWHPIKNGGLMPNHLTLGSNKNVWWQCSEGHEWQATVGRRACGGSCKECRKNNTTIKPQPENSLATKNPTLASQWHPDKNEDFTPIEAFVHSERKVWWQCSKGHEWKASIKSRTQGNGCRICETSKVPVYKTLAVKCPKLLNEWHNVKNGVLSAFEVGYKSGKKVWWKCVRGHEWEAVIANRTNGHQCPYCIGKKVSMENCLVSTHPALLKEWDFDKNKTITPYDVSKGSNKKVWWKCEKGHEWESTVANRTRCNCPKCKGQSQTSFAEQVLYFYLKQLFPNTINRHLEFGFEIDIYVPELALAIEYDGVFYHQKKRAKDIEKNVRMKEKNVHIMRVRQIGLSSLQDTGIIEILCAYDNLNYIELEKTVKNVLHFVLENFALSTVQQNDLYRIVNTLDVQQDMVDIKNNYITIEVKKSIVFTHPALVMEWHIEKNKKLKPTFFSQYSSTNVWWKCSEGHEWQRPIRRRIGKNGLIQCPHCKQAKKSKNK